MSRKTLGLALGVVGALIGLSVGLLPILRNISEGKPRDALTATLDTRGPYVIAATEASSQQFHEAIEEARKLHPGSKQVVFAPENLEPVKRLFRQQKPRYAMVFILPTELDVNFAWKWLRLSTEVDDDPFVDVRTGFITGKDPAAALRFVHRIRSAVENKASLPGLAIDNLGPNSMAGKDDFYKSKGNFMIPVLTERLGQTTISHGTNGFGAEQLGSLYEAGIIHFGGHGYPDRVVDGLSGAQVRQLKLAPCVVFNGACYTGVTGRWFELGDKVVQRDVDPGVSFCLAMLDNNALGYLAALHPDHGVPVYQEMEFLATDGASLGDIIKHTHDGVILANGGKLPVLEPLTNGIPSPAWTSADYMLKGTASRVLFGDPALVLTAPFAKSAFNVNCQTNEADALLITAMLRNTKLKATFTDTYFSDLSSIPNLFNDRALITCKLPESWERVGRVDLLEATAKGKSLKARLQGFGVEKEGDTQIFHAQVDLPTTGYMQSEFRVADAKIALKISR